MIVQTSQVDLQIMLYYIQIEHLNSVINNMHNRKLSYKYFLTDFRKKLLNTFKSNPKQYKK